MWQLITRRKLNIAQLNALKPYINNPKFSQENLKMVPNLPAALPQLANWLECLVTETRKEFA